MARRKHKRHYDQPELDVTTFMNLMVVLVPFLLIGAVFSRITIMELTVPTGAGGAVADKPNFTVEVIVRKAGLEIANGSTVEAAIPKKDDHYDLEMLTDILTRIKAEYPEKEDATVLMEPEIDYDSMIQVMDRVRLAETPLEGSDQVEKMVLFPSISIGDAP